MVKVFLGYVILINANICIFLQITYTILFFLVIAFISDALSSGPDKLPLLSHDVSFSHEFQENVMIAGNDLIVEGFVDSVRLAWAVHLMTIQDRIDSRETVLSASSNDNEKYLFLHGNHFLK